MLDTAGPKTPPASKPSSRRASAAGHTGTPDSGGSGGSGSRSGRGGSDGPELPRVGLGPLAAVLGLAAVVTAIVLFLHGEGRPAVQPAEQVTLPIIENDCPIPGEADPEVLRVVYEVGSNRGASGKVMLAAFEAGWVESRMHNLDCGDRDSLGVFQQRPSQGWGTPAEIRDVEYAAIRFFEKAEVEYTRAPELSAGELAQAVQVSAFPERYDEAESIARELLGQARGLAAG